MINLAVMMQMYLSAGRNWLVPVAYALGIIGTFAAIIGVRQIEKEHISKGSDDTYYAKDTYKITVSSYKNKDGQTYWKAVSEDYKDLSFEGQ